MFANRQNRNAGDDSFREKLYLAATGTNQIDVNDQVINISAITGTSTFKLPHVREAVGRHYTVSIAIASGTHVTTLTTYANDGVRGWANLTLDANGDHVTLFSNGERWIIVENKIA